MKTTAATRTVSATRDGMIVVELTVYGEDGKARPNEEQPPHRFQVWLTVGPAPKILQTFKSAEDAWTWADKPKSYPALPESEISKEFLKDAFPTSASLDNSSAATPTLIARVRIIGRNKRALKKQFSRRWLLCKDDKELTPLFGEKNRAAIWSAARDAGFAPADPLPTISAAGNPLPKARKNKVK